MRPVGAALLSFIGATDLRGAFPFASEESAGPLRFDDAALTGFSDYDDGFNGDPTVVYDEVGS